MRLWLFVKHNILELTLGAVLVVLVLVGLAVHSAKPVPLGPEPELVTGSTLTPNEQKPARATYKWQGNPSDPKYIVIPHVAEGFIQKVGIDQHKAIAVPSNIHMAGWFVDSVLPGKKGLSIIDGHVDGPTQPGIFTNLAKAKVGSNFTITFGNGDIKQFRVKKVTTVDASKAETKLFDQDPKLIRQLNLITCGGTYNKTVGYDKRVIVSAEFVD